MKLDWENQDAKDYDDNYGGDDWYDDDREIWGDGPDLPYGLSEDEEHQY